MAFSKLAAVFAFLKSGRTLKLLFGLILKLMSDYKAGLGYTKMVAEAAFFMVKVLKLPVEHVDSDNLLRIIKVTDWLIAEVYSLFPGKVENLKKLPD